MVSGRHQKSLFAPYLEGAARVAAPCAHFGTCGGCLLQDFAYSDQVRAKAAFLRTIYAREVAVHAAPQPLGYRSRMDYVYAFGKLGLRERGQYRYVTDVHDCHLLPEHARFIFKAARELVLASGLRAYNYLRHEGYLRYLVIRHSLSTQETMLILTTAAADEETAARTQQLMAALLAIAGVTSVHWTVQADKTDVSVGEQREYLGQEHITDNIGGIPFRIGPKTFFQGNTRGASDLFTRAVAHAHGKTLDLYCGVGVLSLLALAQPAVASVVGVEENAASIEAARENTQSLSSVSDDERCGALAARPSQEESGPITVTLRGRSRVARPFDTLQGSATGEGGAKGDAAEGEGNFDGDVVEHLSVAEHQSSRSISFFAMKVQEYLAQLESADTFDTVICDPARPGLGPVVCEQLRRLAPRTIIYISCNPLTHKEDIDRMCASGAYTVDVLEGYDLFPQTAHVEVLSVLTRS
jgi:tRNA/tmRNA/rRNA uracil-C5-methylase (TrmA/RlmC/RlmD family)